jgi:hypothetical protein
MTESELHALREKIRRLTEDADKARRSAKEAMKLAAEHKIEAEQYRHFWENAEQRLQKSSKQRSIHDWFWTVVFAVGCLLLVKGITGWPGG